MKYKVFSTTAVDSMTQPMFFGATPNIARYDIHKYPVFNKLTDNMVGYSWRPDEFDLSKDSKDFRELVPHEQHIFISNLLRQIVLDSVQGRSPSVALLPFVSNPELETLIETWAYFETVHSRSYTYIIQNIFPDPSIIFDQIMEIEKIVDDAKKITEHYDSFIEYGNWYNMLGFGDHTINGEKLSITEYELKKRFYLMIISINILEGIRFYVSFACSWAFAQQQHRMEGNAKVIKTICRDENLHLGITQNILKRLPEDDPIFVQIIKDCEPTAIQMYKDAVQDEKEWAAYLFKDGSMLGLNEQLLCDYVEFMANRRMKAIGLGTIYKQPIDPLSWTKHWINSEAVQVAPQETELTSYTIGAVVQDVVAGQTFADFSL